MRKFLCQVFLMFALTSLLYEDMAYLFEKKSGDPVSWWKCSQAEDESEKSKSEEKQGEKDSKSGKKDKDEKEEGQEKMGPSSAYLDPSKLLSGQAYGRSLHARLQFNLPSVLLPVATPPPKCI